ncbi:MAG: hypothetical protein HY898_08395 [Deltaproteobacteria bacterium]|nr:hypothetical protein [Deltaproteobacteria bacterium]
MTSKSQDTSKAWSAAEWQYDMLHAERMLASVLGPTDTAERLKEIVDLCPTFYPALIELGVLRIETGQADGAQNVEEGLTLLLSDRKLRRKPEEAAEAAQASVANLHDLFRFDLSRPFLQKMVERAPRNAWFHMELAHAVAMLGDPARAWELSEHATELDPDNGNWWNDRGLYALMGGDAKRATQALERSRRLGGDSTALDANFDVLGWMERHEGKTYFDYLLRPVDYDGSSDGFEADTDEAIDDINSYRLIAMGVERLRGGTISTFPPLASNIRGFFRAIGRDVFGEPQPLLMEDIDGLRREIEMKLNGFVIRHRDADGKLIHGICDALLELYGFLVDRGLVERRARTAFCKRLDIVRPKVVARAATFRAAQKEGALSPEARQKLIREVFGNCHDVMMF